MSNDMFIRPYIPGDEAEMRLRPDMAEALDYQGGLLPAGDKWTLINGGTVCAIGGFVTDTGSYSMWLLVGAMDRSGWARVLHKTREVMAGLKRRQPDWLIWAQASPVPGAVAMLEHLGFHASATDGEYYA